MSLVTLKMFWLKLIFPYFVTISCQAAYIEQREIFKIKTLNLVAEYRQDQIILGVGLNPHIFPYQCNQIGRYPDPYDCRSYFNCDNITAALNEAKNYNEINDELEKNTIDSSIRDGCKNKSMNIWNAGIIPTEYCTCPKGTYWGGPSTGCISDDSRDMETCCRFQPNCHRFYGEDGDFEGCSLTALGYNYTCSRDRDFDGETMVIHVGKSQNSHREFKNQLSSKLNHLNLEKFKVLPQCTSIRHFDGVGFENRPGLYGHYYACTIKYKKISSKEEDDFPLRVWAFYKGKILTVPLDKGVFKVQ